MRKRRAFWQPSGALLAIVSIAIGVVSGYFPNLIPLQGGALPWVSGAFVVLSVIALWGARGGSRTNGPITPDQRAAKRETLAGLVARQWREELAIRRLDKPHPMPVGWRLTADERVMDHRENVSRDLLGPVWEGSADHVKGLAAQFLDLPRRRLVICGDSGMGKTTLAVQLILELIDSRAADDPVPVLLPVAGWDTERFERFQDWVADRLSDDYRSVLTRREAADLVADGDILPVLDGMDEVSPSVLEAMLLALNKFMTAVDGLIVTSRSGEYAEAVLASEALTAAAVVEPDPLPPGAAAEYLARSISPADVPRWSRVLAHLRLAKPDTRSPLTTIAATPFGLWLLRRAHSGKDADIDAVLKHRTVEELRTHLFDALPAALIADRRPTRGPMMPFRPRHRWDPVRLTEMLGRLASIMEDAAARDGTRGRDLAWWQLARHTIPSWTVGEVAALAVSLIGEGVSRLVAVMEGASGEAAENLRIVGASMVALAAVTMAAARRWPENAPGFAALAVRGRLGNLGAEVARGFVSFPSVLVSTWLVLISGLGVGQRTDPGTGLIVALLSGTMFWLVASLVFWAETPNPATRASTPLTSLRDDRRLNVLRVFMTGMLPGLVLGLVVARITDPSWGLTLGMLAAVGGSCFLGNHHAWFAYQVAAIGLGLVRRELPWRLMPFLDDCHRLGLLRAVGPVYQFRHADLHDHFAGRAGSGTAT
ncbi:NACHT domain-containing NTPase [Planotetraspora sp. GP83]|uniref:NACHT domain-containing NTPase n=1 Tax=Planotetraspora sp. GP83 TaxID=3156264 RepID=UPI003513D77A